MAPHRRPAQFGSSRSTRAVVLSAAASAAVVLGVLPVAAEPGVPSSAGDAAELVDELFTEAERAVEKYNGVAERVELLEEEVELRQQQVERGQQRVNDKRYALGSVAAAEYRNGGLAPSVALLLSPDPDNYLARASSLDRINSRQAGELRELRAARRSLEQRRTEAADVLTELLDQKSELTRNKEEAQRKLAAARRQYEQLSAEEREERERVSRSSARAAVAQTPAEKPSPAASAPPSASAAAPAGSGRGAAAVAAAQSAVGRPYAWGQAGPAGFDCSGLMQWAYAQAGVSLPRTSQSQAGAGRRVSLDQAQPGDLVLYRADNSHVAMYIGGGQVVHAPYPGAQVRYEPVGMMSVSAVVRP